MLGKLSLSTKAISVFILPSVMLLLSVTAVSSNSDDKCFDNYGREIPCPSKNISFTIEKVSNKERIQEREEVTFTITVKNVGEVEVNEVRIRDFLPSELERVEGDIEWTLNGFAPGETEELQVTARAKDQVVGMGSEKQVTNIARLEFEGISMEDEADVIIFEGDVSGVQDEMPKVLPATASGDDWYWMGLVAGLALAIGAGLKEFSDKKIRL